MNFVAYRNGKIGYPSSKVCTEGVYLEILEMGKDAYYTPHGFIYPLDGAGPCPSDLFSNKVPLMNAVNSSINSSAFMITKEGGVCQADVFSSIDRDGYTSDFHMLPSGPDSIYAVSPRPADRHRVLAALATWESEEKFSKDISNLGLGGGKKIIWVSVVDVIKRLNELYPTAE